MPKDKTMIKEKMGDPLGKKQTMSKAKTNRPMDSTLKSIVDEISAGMYSSTAMDFMSKKKMQIPSMERLVDTFNSNPGLLEHAKKLMRKYYHADKGGRNITAKDIDHEVSLYIH